MKWSGPAKEESHAPDTRHALHITLCEGFRGHTVVIAVDGDDLVVSAYPRLAISLVGEGTVSFETSGRRFT